MPLPFRRIRVRRFLAAACALCAAATVPAAGAQVLAAYTGLGPEGVAQARVVTTAGQCPAIRIDGKRVPMSPRAAAGEAPLRNGAQPDAKAADFPVLTCEATLPAGARTVRVQGWRLPVPKQQTRRIVVVGDTGCRIKASDDYFQKCNQPSFWPWGRVIRAAAAWRPDLVIHVGDYHYRESPCPPGMRECARSPWGYGYDAWAADLFGPAAPLLRAAPWVFARGNHEICARAGQGWFRLLDPRPYSAAQSCDDPAKDFAADYTEPYAVPLSADLQLIVFDSASAKDKAYGPDDPVFRRYSEEFAKVAELARQRPHSIFISHHALLGYASTPDGKYRPGNQGLQSVLAAQNGARLFPPGIDAAIHGHVHMFQALAFSSGQPATLIAGNSGSSLEWPLAGDPPADVPPAPGAVLSDFSKRSEFGFLTMEQSATGWRLTERDELGRPRLNCLLQGPALHCRAVAARNY